VSRRQAAEAAARKLAQAAVAGSFLYSLHDPPCMVGRQQQLSQSLGPQKAVPHQLPVLCLLFRTHMVLVFVFQQNKPQAREPYVMDAGSHVKL
jgi:hypothetical protein